MGGGMASYPKVRWWSSVDWTRVTGLYACRLLLFALLVLPTGSQPLTALTAQQYNGLPPPIPSFVYYRDPQPQTVQKLLFTPINTPYSQYLLGNNLRSIAPQTPPLPGAVRLTIANPALGFRTQNGYEIRENHDNDFGAVNSDDYSLPARNNFPVVSYPGSLLQGYNSFGTSFGNSFPSENLELNQAGRSSRLPIHQISQLRYASSFPQSAGHEEGLGKALRSLSPTLEQRQRSAANAGELVYRQQRVGAKPFLSSDSEGVQREGGEELSSPGGFLGLPHRRPTFVSAVGTPVSGVAQNPLYTRDSVQASKLDEASDVKGVKSPGGIPAPGRLPVSHDVQFARPFIRYANNFGYSTGGDPTFNPLSPPFDALRGSFAPPIDAYSRSVINR